LSPLENRDNVQLIFCDFFKASDRVWHQGLFHKLEHYGITGSLLKWFINYLSFGQQLILQNVTSECMHTNAGAPQGSVLAPMLFLLYINDLPDAVTSPMRLFADDATVLKIYSDPSECQYALSEDLQSTSDWSDKWRMVFL
jgi:hypothetical protein